MSLRDQSIESLLGSLRACHEPTPGDRRRVRASLDVALAEGVVGDEGGVCREGAAEREETSGVHSRPRVAFVARRGSGVERPRWRARVRRSQLLVGAIALAAAAAIAVVAFARPASFGTGRLADALPPRSAGDLLPQTRTPLRPEPLRLEPIHAAALPSALGASSQSLAAERPCVRWPCFADSPASGWSLAGAQLAVPAAGRDPGLQRPGVHQAAPLLRDADSSGRARRVARLEVVPTLAVDVAREGAAVGVGVRVAVPVTKKRELSLQATAERFEADARRWRSRWALGTGFCWSPVQGTLEVALCGTLGYERERAELKREQAWRVTAGAEAHAVWRLTPSTGVYLAVQTVSPVAGDRLRERGAVMRLVAGPQFSF